MKINELREVFADDGFYVVRVEGEQIISSCRIEGLPDKQAGKVATLFYSVNGQVLNGFTLSEDEFVTSMRALREAYAATGYSAFESD
ncbi:hypothetical protein [Escherichia coli]|uniref:hypothetical protein n=1 Tax=Escherichia coli TaxID=562 RepID=UPI000BE150A5|nr:hypothetical protein [Escherichia coli]